MENLFAYGTLMCEDIMQEVSGYSLPHVPGILRGYRRKSVKGEHYPAVVVEREAWIEGVVYRNVPHSAWVRLDRFEGEMYARRLLQVELNDGGTVPAATYVVQPQFESLLASCDWDFADFQRNGKAPFQKYCKGYRTI